MNRKQAIKIAGICCAVLLSGCRKDLCYDHDSHALSARANVRPTWECVWERDYGKGWHNSWPEEFGCEYERFCPDPATGIATFVYHEDGSRTEQHLPAEGGEVPMSEGTKNILLYNDDTRYIVFSDLDSWASASATTRTRTRSTYNREHGNELTVNAPDILYGTWIESYKAIRTEEPVALPVTMRPLVYTYLIRYEFDSGLEYVALARGALSGMAGSVYLQDGHTGDEAVTVLYDCELTAFGTEAAVTSFGVPEFPGDHYVQRSDRRYGLNLEVRLLNGKIKTFEFDITEQLAQQPRGGVITVSGLEVSEQEAGGGAGFDAEVEGWGEFEDIELPLN